MSPREQEDPSFNDNKREAYGQQLLIIYKNFPDLDEALAEYKRIRKELALLPPHSWRHRKART
jgi:hypothetical protein